MEGELTERSSVSALNALVSQAHGRLEAYLTIRGQEYLASLGQAQSALDSVANPAEVREAFAPGSGMDGGAPATKGLKKRGAN